MPIDLQTLNDNQRQAVLWKDGPLLVLAGPGSGKTRVLTLRIVRLLEERDDVSILALTFTNKAAAEMRERVDDLLGQRGERASLCTFHAFATEILRQHGSHLGLRPDFGLLTRDEDRIAILEPIALKLANEGCAVPTDWKNLLTLLDRLFAESYEGGADIPAIANPPDWLPRLFNAYCDMLIRSNQLDFGSLLGLARRLLREKPGVARVIRLGWTHVCVDEFQDTNRAQYDLLKLIVAEQRPNLFVVGDDDQIIYQWNGASPERLEALRADYGMNVIQLPENYRCPREIVDLANRLIVHNQMRASDKRPLAAQRSANLEGDVIRYGVYNDPTQEAAVIAHDIQTRCVGAPSDCVILARTVKMLESAADALRAVGIEPYLAQRKNDFASPIVRVLLQTLRLANAPHDREVLRRLCVAWTELTERAIEVEDVAASAALMGGDFLRAWITTAIPETTGAVGQLLEQVRAALLERLDFSAIVEWFLTQGWQSWAEVNGQDLNEEIQIWNELHGQITREHGPDDLTLNIYLHHMDLAAKVPPPPLNAVRCLTVHGSKGLEFRHVYLIGMAQEVLPSFQALRKGSHSRELEEERRNCFVAITRARDSLTLTRSRRYFGWVKEPSQFLAEMGIAP